MTRLGYKLLAFSTFLFAFVSAASAMEAEELQNMNNKFVAHSQALRIHIPERMRQAHEVEIDGSFISEKGIETHSRNPHTHPISRIRDLSLTDTKFHFFDLYLNETGYTFYVWLKDPKFNVIKASSRTDFQVVNYYGTPSNYGTAEDFAPVFGSK